MRALVTGAAGFVGGALLRRAPAGVRVLGTRHRAALPAGVEAAAIDLTEAEPTRLLVQRHRPDVVIHAAYRQDGDLGRDVVDMSTNVAAACAAAGARLVHLSSDVVFDGERAPYAEAAPPRPVSAYGRAKAAAEVEVGLAVPDVTIVRTSLVLAAPAIDPRTRFVADALAAGTPVDAYEDEVRMPVHVDDLADGLWRLAALDRAAAAGVWHLVGPEALSRLELARLVAARTGGDPALVRAVPSPRDPDDPRPRDLRLTTRRGTTVAWAPRSIRAAYRAPGTPDDLTQRQGDVDGA